MHVTNTVFLGNNDLHMNQIQLTISKFSEQIIPFDNDNSDDFATTLYFKPLLEIASHAYYYVYIDSFCVSKLFVDY